MRETFEVRTVLTNSPIEAAGIIKRGGVVAFPTETVYGLGANVFDENAIAKIFEAKRRPADNPLIAHISAKEQIAELAAEVPANAQIFIDRFFPGPLTIVVRKADIVPSIATAGLETIGIRMPRAVFAHCFIEACGVPVAAPSANISGRPSPTTWQAVLEDLDGRIDCILQGEGTEIGIESTVVDCTTAVPMILRPGLVSLEDLQALVPETVSYRPDPGDAAKSPGLKHLHYSPAAKVVITDGNVRFEETESSAYIGIERPDAKLMKVGICADVSEYAHSIFEFFRECDRLGIETIYCQAVENFGIGRALMDRLMRAAAKR